MRKLRRVSASETNASRKRRRGDDAPGESAAHPTARRPSKQSKTPGTKSAPKGAPTKFHRLVVPQKPVFNVAPSIKLDIFVFGEGSAGELGLGSGSNSTEVAAPRLNPNLDATSVGIVQVACGGMHSVALSHDGRVYTWGINDEFTLARDTTWDGGMRDADASDEESTDGPNPLESTPTAISADLFPRNTKFTQVVAGDSTTFVLTDSGYVYGCGTFRDINGVYGFTLSETQELIKRQQKPLLIPGLSKVKKLSAGNDFVLALTEDGSVFAWGTGQQDQLGRRILDRRRAAALLPTRVGFPRRSIKIASIHAASNHAFAIDTKGETWAWGLNNFGQTGISSGAGEGGSTVTTAQKVRALAGKKMRMLAGGSHHSIGITDGGECLVWGRMDGGQLGLDLATLPLDDPTKVVQENGKPRILLEPTPLPIMDCVYVTAGPEHNIVVTNEGKAFSWGFNATYQLGQGGGEDILVAKLMNGKAIRDRKLIWAGAGGQYSMLAAAHEDGDSAAQ